MKSDVFSKHSGSRPLKVGEMLRHALSDLFLRGEAHIPALEGASITISEVRVSPDLRNATVYVMPLGGRSKEPILKALAENAGQIRRTLANRIELRFMPMLHYRLDQSFEEANKVNELLHSPEVRRDLETS